MNFKIKLFAFAFLIIASSAIASEEQSKEPLTPRTLLLRTCNTNLDPKTIAEFSGDLITAVIEKDEAPALLYAFIQHDLDPNKLNKDGHPAFIVVTKLEEQEKVAQKFRLKFVRSIKGNNFKYKTCDYCEDAICAEAGMKNDGKWHPPIICSLRQEDIEHSAAALKEKRKYPLSSYIPHLKKIGCLTTIKAKSNDQYNGKSFQEITWQEADKKNKAIK